MSSVTLSNPAIINGTQYWSDVNNIKLEDGEFAKCATTIVPHDRVIKLFQGPATEEQSEDKAYMEDWSEDLVWLSFGGPTDKWNLSWTPAIINSVNFGFAIAISMGTYTDCGGTHYSSSGKLELSNFGFNIPTGAVIDGIKAEVKVSRVGTSVANVDNVKITVYYTGGETSTKMQLTIGANYKVVNADKIAIDGAWKSTVSAKQSIGGEWKNVF